MFLQSLVKLSNSLSVQILSPNSGEDQKKKVLVKLNNSISVQNFAPKFK